MLPGCRHFSENNNSSGLFDLLYPELSTFLHIINANEFMWSLVHHTIFDKLLGKRSNFSQKLSKLLTRSAQRRLKRANVQKNRIGLHSEAKLN